MRATLTYHSIDDSGSPISVGPRAFAEHLRWLAAGHVEVVGLADLARRSDQAGPAVAITFDDAFGNIETPVAELRARGLPVTIFAVTGECGRTNAWGGLTQPGIPLLPLLSWDGLGRLASLGATIEGHTRTHRALTALSTSALEDELGGCREDLMSQLGIAAEHLAYPYGDVDARVLEATRRVFKWAHTTEFRLLREVDDAMRMPRIDMYYLRGPRLLERYGTPAFRALVGRVGLRRLARNAAVGGGYPGGRRRWTR